MVKFRVSEKPAKQLWLIEIHGEIKPLAIGQKAREPKDIEITVYNQSCKQCYKEVH